MNDGQYIKIEKIKEKWRVNKSNLGKAGEYFVAAKLYLNGFNVYMGGIDDGIDLVARKKEKFYYIQVKTCQDIEGYDSGKFMAKVNLSSLSKFPTNETYLVLVLHFLGINSSIDNVGDHNRYEQEFIVIPTIKLYDFIGKTAGDCILYIYYSMVMENMDDNTWIVKLKHGKNELIADNFLLDSFWQIEI